MKKLIALVLVLVLALGMVACTAEKPAETTGTKELKVGAIYINSKNDTAGYTFAHHNGITTAMKELGLDVDTQLFIVDEVAEDKEKVLAAVDTLVGQGVDIIFGNSFGYIDAMAEAAAEEFNQVAERTSQQLKEYQTSITAAVSSFKAAASSLNSVKPE